MPTLRELQSDFLAAILDGGVGSSVGVAEQFQAQLVAGAYGTARGLAVYTNNAEHHYLESLRKSFPVVQRLVGEEYFRQCAREFRGTEPSQSGDLQHVGAGFPEYLLRRHGNDGHRYLVEIARLEWLYQSASTAADHPPFDFAKLARVPTEDYDALRFILHPSVRLFSSEFPALAIWRENLRSDQEPEIIDLGVGGERLLLARAAAGFAAGIDVRPLVRAEFVFLQAIEGSLGFGACIAAAAAIDPDFDASAALETFVCGQVIVDLTSERP
jgi:hypothetical protein